MIRRITLLLCLLLTPAAALAETPCQVKPVEHAYKETASGRLKAHVFQPPGMSDSPRPAIVIFHGGGWIMGEPSWAFWLGERYACLGAVVVIPQYRLSAKDAITPIDAMADARHAIQWTRKQARALNLDPQHIAAMGWSAGAHLAASSAVFTDNAPDSAPDLLALVSPAVSVTEDHHFKALLDGQVPVRDLSPAHHVRPGLPPTVIVTGRTDTVTPLSGVMLFHDRMVASGNFSVLHVFENVGHMFTPAGQPDDGWPNPDKNIERQAYEAVDHFLSFHGYLPAAKR